MPRRNKEAAYKRGCPEDSGSTGICQGKVRRRNGTINKAGLRAGDRIVTLAGMPATGGVEAMRHLLGLTSGDMVELTFEREGKLQKAKAPLAFDATGVLGRPGGGARGG